MWRWTTRSSSRLQRLPRSFLKWQSVFDGFEFVDESVCLPDLLSLSNNGSIHVRFMHWT